MKYYQLNQRITALQVKLVNEEGKYVGIMPTSEALKLALDKGLDLVQIDPKGDPPVVKIVDFSQFKYLQKKKEGGSSKIQGAEMKTVWLSPKISTHDLEVKKNQIEKFLAKKKKVKIDMILKGRDKAHADLALKEMQDFVESLAPVSKAESAPKILGKNITIIISPI